MESTLIGTKPSYREEAKEEKYWQLRLLLIGEQICRAGLIAETKGQDGVQVKEWIDS